MNFRRWITALAVLAVFAVVASAQVIQPTPINCSVSAAANKAIRSEGVAEMVGDIILTCSGGPTPSAGNPADRATIQVDLGVNVTSRTSGSVTDVGNISEAVLLIDEPVGSGTGIGPIPGYGQNATMTVCDATAGTGSNNASPQTTCPAYAQSVQGYWVIANQATSGFVHAKNVYQGTVGTSNPTVMGGPTRLTFANVPVVSTGSASVQRVYRISNVRVNPGSAGAITANVTVTPATGAVTTLNLTNASATVATPQASLTTTVTAIGGASLCAPTELQPNANQARANLALLSFKEGFSNAFKTRVLPLSNAGGAAIDGATPKQDQISGSYPIGSPAVTITTAQSESGLVLQQLSIGSSAAGLASTGTRFKANFRGLPTTAKFYVSINNVVDYSHESTAPTNAGDQSNVSWAVMVANGAGANKNATETVASTATVTPFGTIANQDLGIPGVHVVELTPDNNGNAEVVWEVMNVQRDTVENFQFAVYAVYKNTNTPPALGANGTVQLFYAPTTGNEAFQNINGSIPRFNPAGTPQVSFFNVVPCQTSLLFPYVTNQLGYDTGIALSNTSKDPFNTVTSEGTCAMNFYGANAPAVFTTPTITAGNGYANTVGGMGGVNFGGYAIAVCNFQFAHGFAYITAPGWGGPNSASMGYLATVLADTPGRGAALVGESLGM